MKKICFFNSISFWGGGEKLHLENATEFKSKGYDVIVVANPTSLLRKKCEENKIRTFTISISNFSFINPLKVLKLVKLFKSETVDTLVITTSQDLKVGAIAAKIARVKRIVYLRGLAVEVKASILNRWIYKSVLTHIIANSEETKKTILRNLGKYIPSAKVKTIYHGIELPQNLKGKNHKELLRRAHGVVLGNAGRLTPQKGQTNLIKVARILKDRGIDFSLFLAGDGELKDELQHQIDQMGLQEDVFILGFVDDVDAFMSSIDIFLLSSVWEGFGFVLVEAMIWSKPVVAFRISSNPEIVSEEQSGFLVEYPNLQSFAEQTIKLIEDSALREKMGSAAKKSVLERFILSDRVTELEEYLLQS